MPLPHWVARLNKRLTNRLVEPVAARFGHYAVIAHNGRHSNSPYRTPVFVFGDDATRWVPLTYGLQADWVRNVLTSGGTCTWREVTTDIHRPTVVGREGAWPHLPRWVRAALRVLHVRDFLRFESQ